MSNLTEDERKQIDKAVADFSAAADADSSLSSEQTEIIKAWLASFATSLKQRLEENWP